MESFHKRTTSIDKASVESILSGTEQPSDAPSPHIGSSPNRVNFTPNTQVRPIVRPDRALSYTHRKPNRLSLTFPVAPSNRDGQESLRGTPTSSAAPSYPGTPADPSGTTPSPNDTNGFLVALAAQERRVLELKEELDKAENELIQLKRQWAIHEGMKKRAEIRHVEKLQPLPLERASMEETRSTQSDSIDLDRRKSLLANLPHLSPHLSKDQQNPRRKKFTGGHTRTLSLLSPDRSTYSPTIQSMTSRIQPEGISRSTTMPDTSDGIAKDNYNRANRHSYQGGVTHGVKQITEDVKAGLWTFLEDLRQATVGEEGINGTGSRPNTDAQNEVNKRSNVRGVKKGKPHNRNDQDAQRTWDSLTGENPALIDVSGHIWENPEVLNTPKATTVQKKRARPISMPAPAPAPTATTDDDEWPDWDSPDHKSPLRWSGSSTLSGPATPGSGGVEDDVRIMDQNNPDTPSKSDEIQWPVLQLDKLTPSNLKKTVSTMMQEWEKSLTPPPSAMEDRQSTDLLTGSPRAAERRSG